MPDVFAVTVPMENVNDEFATVVECNVGSGTAVKTGEIILTLETQKAVFELEAEKDGFLFHDLAEGDEVRIGSEIAYICKENKRPEIIKEKTTDTGAEGGVSVSAKAAKLMDEYGLRVEDFEGVEKIKLADVKAKAEGMKKRVSGQGAKGRTAAAYEPVKVSPAKKFEIQQLRQSTQNVVPSSVSIMVNVHKVEENIKRIMKEEGVQVTIVELVIFETAQLLKKYRLFNGFHADGGCNVYHDINIGFAVNIGKGLKVPVIKKADQLSVKEISDSVKDLSLKYFREELSLDDLIGGTFTVTDLSTKGIIDFFPVINNLQSAIIGICSVLPGTDHFKIILTFDHNMADGMMAADMLNELSTLLQG